MEEMKERSYGVGGGPGAFGDIPPGPKVTVLTSPYSPPVSSFLPLNRNSTPPAFPALTMTSFRPLTVISSPAVKSSDPVVLPSAVTEIQESSRAWMTTVNSPGAAAGAAESFGVLAVVGEEVVGEALAERAPLSLFVFVTTPVTPLAGALAPPLAATGNGAAAVVGAG